jgi:integrase
MGDVSKTQYLQQLGRSWYLRVKIPASLREKVGSTHIRRALHTRDLDEANRRKWAALAHVHTYLDALATGGSTETSMPTGFNAPTPSTLKLPTVASTEPGTTRRLDALSQEWADATQSKTLRFQRLQVYRELRDFLSVDLSPQCLSDALAGSYVDTCIACSPDSPSTRRRKLSALGAFWEWMAARRYIPRGANPWKGFRLPSSGGTKPQKRPYTMDELVQLFSGTPTYPALREVMALGLYTGARINELCSLQQGDVRLERGVAYLRICKSKTKAGLRTIAVAHPLALGIVKHRFRKTASATQLFPELRGGGYDKKLSWHVGQAFRYHRNGRGLTGATDFHSLRRTFVTQLENLGVDQVRIARYIGHALPTLAFQLYSGGATEVTQRATGRTIRYPREVEAAVKRFLSQQ